MHEFISFFPSLVATQPELKSWETVTTLIRSLSLREATEQYRQALARADKPLMKKLKQACPAVICQARMEGGRTREHLGAFTGNMMVDFDHVDEKQLGPALNLIRADKHTMLCYVTLSGRGLRVIARVEGGVTPTNYRAAWLTVNEYYGRLTGLTYDAQCVSLTRMCGLAYDPQAYFNPLAQRLKINMALGRPSARTGKGAGRPPKADNVGKRVRTMVDADGAVYAEGQHNDYVSRCIYLMNRYGVDQQACTDWALHEFEDYAASHPHSVEQIVKSIYLNKANEHATLSFASKSKKANIKDVEQYIAKHYSIRFNVMSNKLEYCSLVDKDSSFGFIDDRFVNSLWRQMHHDGIFVELVTLHNILGSDFSRPFHPFREWIEQLPAWDGQTEHIRQFFSMVHYLDISDEDFHRFTRSWFLAMVASVLFDDVINHCILTFIGRQGTYKSTFMQYILPPHLRHFFATKSNSFQISKDDKLMLAQNVIVSLEEIDLMSPKEISQLKAFTTMPYVDERPPYGHTPVHMPRIASLTATGNNLTFLSDQTGNRRWLPFHVDYIDCPQQAHIPYEGMYAQALALIRSQERYWLNDDDIRWLDKYNHLFMAPDAATEMIVTYYCHPRSEAETKYLTATKISARFAPSVKISPTKIGLSMSALGFEQVRLQNGRYWKVAERPQCDIDNKIPDVENSENQADDLPF